MIIRAKYAFGPAIAVLAVVLLAVSPVQAQSDETETLKRQQIREIMQITGAVDIGGQVIEMMVGQIAPALEQLNPGQGALVASILRNEFMDVVGERMGEFENLIIDVYDDRFSAEEIDGLLAFYRTPLGLRLIEELPELFQQSMLAGQAWGQRIGEEAVRRAFDAMQEQGLETPT